MDYSQRKLWFNWLDDANLLSYKELEKLFPNRKIFLEKFLGLSKSFIVI